MPRDVGSADVGLVSSVVHSVNVVTSGSSQHGSTDDDPEVISPAAYVSNSCVVGKRLDRFTREAHLITLLEWSSRD